MSNVQKWIDNPKRGYKAGVKLYNNHKIDKRHDDFFDTDEPGSLHTNMLYAQMLKINNKLKRNFSSGDHSQGKDSKKKSDSRIDKSTKAKTPEENNPIKLPAEESTANGNVQGNKTPDSDPGHGPSDTEEK